MLLVPVPSRRNGGIFFAEKNSTFRIAFEGDYIGVNKRYTGKNLATNAIYSMIAIFSRNLLIVCVMRFSISSLLGQVSFGRFLTKSQFPNLVETPRLM